MTSNQPSPTEGVLEGRATPRGAYSHVRRAGDLLFTAGISARRPDNSIAGADIDAMGTVHLDIRAQTHAVLDNIQSILRSAGAEMTDVVEVSSFLVDMNDFGGYNAVYADWFGGALSPPARTTVAVHQLPHPQLLVEIKVVACKPLPR